MANNNRINVTLGFNADTSSAQRELQKLSQQLNQISNLSTTSGSNGITKQMQEASKAATELRAHLASAINQDTGKLNFDKFSQSLKASGKTISDYGAKLSAIGPQGTSAFAQLTKSIVDAEVPMRRSNQLLNQFWTTLKNTAKWQISSSILHGFIGSLQSAYGYAQDLNESLNNIRIVTGYNVDKMAEFAVQANKAAKALSTTTTEYTNASLIYFQQGLTDDEVQKRTDITVKMANVTRESVETVSDQLTAVWNNFYDGSKSLEYYADVMTALGAKTASSADEIAGGLEKFAAIGDTIGLSYEYAASALATITSNTRQSEEVVGTALKTIFARIQGLNLGETLDDGTTLNKYSEALATVGVNIYDQAGGLKEMDNILDELAAKWDTLGGAEQAALAQTVAGVRQYTQLIALMENWNDGSEDSFTANLNTIENSSGALQEQSDIYAESWEAASKRVTASLEKIYSSLLDDEFFIGLTDTLADIIGVIGQVTDALGGLPGVLSIIGVLVTKVFSKQLTQSFQDLAYNIQISTKAGRQYIQEQKNMMAQEAVERLKTNFDNATPAQQAQGHELEKQLKLKQEILNYEGELTEAQQTEINLYQEQYEQLSNKIIKIHEGIEKLRIASEEVADEMLDIQGIDPFSSLSAQKSFRQKMEQDFSNIDESFNPVFEKIKQSADGVGPEVGKKIIEDLKISMSQAGLSQSNIDNIIDIEWPDILDQNEATLVIQKIKKQVEEAFIDMDAVAASAELNLDTNSEQVTEFENGLKRQAQIYQQINQKQQESKKLTENQVQLQKSIGEVLEQNKTQLQSMAQGFVSMGRSLSSLGMLVNSFNSLMDTLSNPDISGWEKFGQILMTVSFLSGSFFEMIRSGKEAFTILTSAQTANTISTIANALAHEKAEKATDAHNDEKLEGVVANDAHTASLKRNTAKVQENAIKNRAWKKAGSDLIKVAKKAGPVIKSVGLITAGIAVLAGTLYGVSELWNQETNAAEKARKKADEAREAYNNLNTTLSAFANLSNSYSEAASKLSELTKGTQEYADQLKIANEAALKLIETNDNLDYTYKNGVITIDQNRLNEINQQNERRLQTSLAESIYLDSKAETAELNATMTEFNRKIGGLGFEDFEQNIGSAILAGLGSAAGVALITAGLIAAGAVTGGVGAVVGAGVVAGLVGGGVSAGAGAANSSTQAEEDLIQKLAVEVEYNDEVVLSKESIKAILNYDAVDDATKTSIDRLIADENIDATKDLVTELAKNSQQVKENTLALIENLGDGISDDIIEKRVVGSIIKNATVRSQENVPSQAERLGSSLFTNILYNKAIEDIKTVYGQDFNYDEAYKWYAQENNYQTIKGESLTWSSDKVKYKSADGKDSIKVEPVDIGKAYVAYLISQSGDTILSNFNKLIDEDSGYKDNPEEKKALVSALLTSATDFVEGISYEELQSLRLTDIGDGKQVIAGDSLSLGPEIVEAYNLTQEQIDQMQAFQEKRMQTLENKYADTPLNELFNEKSRFSANELKDIFNAGSLVLSTGSQELVDQFISNINNMDKEGVQPFVDTINDTDFTNFNLQEFKNDLRDSGGQWEDWMEDFLQEIVDSSIVFSDFAATSEQTRKKAKALTSVISDIKNIGDTISPESYKELPDNIKSYFTLMEDGTYALTVSAKIFQEAARKARHETYQTQITNNRRDAEKIKMGLSTIGIESPTEVTAKYLQQQVNEVEWKKLLETLGIEDTVKSDDSDRYLREYSDEIYSLVTQYNNLIEDTEKLSKEYASTMTAAELRENRQYLTREDQAIYGDYTLDKEFYEQIENDELYEKYLEREKAKGRNDLNEIRAEWLAYEGKQVLKDSETIANLYKQMQSDDPIESLTALDTLQTNLAKILDVPIESITEEFLTKYGEIITNLAEDGALAVLKEAASGGFVPDSSWVGHKEYYQGTYDRTAALAEGTTITGEDPATKALLDRYQLMIKNNGFNTQKQMLDFLSQFGLTDVVFNESLFETTTTEDGQKIKILREGLTEEQLGSIIVSAIKKTRVDDKEVGSFTPDDLGGGSTDTFTPEEIESLDEALDRYKEINDQLADIDQELKDIERDKKRAWGADKLAAYDKEIAKYKDQVTKLREKADLIKDIYLQDDKLALENAAKAAGVNSTLIFGGLDNLNLTNYKEIVEEAYNIYKAQVIAYNNLEGKASEEAQKRYDEAVARWEALLEAIEQYDSTKETYRDTLNSAEDAVDSAMQAAMDKWSYALEIDVKLNENDLKILDRQISRLGDSFDDVIEAFSLMLTKMNTLVIDKEGEFDFAADYDSAWIELENLYKSGEISPEHYMSGAQSLFDQIDGALNELIEMDKEMVEYYSKALDAAGEEMSFLTGQMEQLTSALDHYKSIIELIDGEYAYDKIGIVLEGRVETLKNEMDAAISYYDMLRRQREAIESQLATATGEKEKEVLQAQLEAIVEATNEAQEEMLSKTEEWAEATKAVMENAMAEAARTMEMEFTDGLTFDFLSSSMDRLSSYQDEYLTKTNQIYETEKLMRTAQMEADKTTNKAAKQRLQNYINETAKLRDKNQLSQLELEIQQANYDILLAQIALEEAQNAKSTVRLQRDSEGNFGYVYTADSEKVSQAEQELADAQNKLYNIGLEAANDYGQKRIELQQQLADDLIALEERRVNGEFETEAQYQAAKDQLLQEYTNLFTAYSNQYTTAMSVNAGIQQEAWVTAYQDIIDKTNMWSDESTGAFGEVGDGIAEWATIVQDYMGDCETAYTSWKDNVTTNSALVNDVLNNTEREVGEVTTKSQELSIEVDRAVTSIEGDLSRMQSAAVSWAQTVGAQVDALINKYLELMQTIQAAMNTANSGSGSSTTTNPYEDSSLTDEILEEEIKGMTPEEAAEYLAKRGQELVTHIHYGTGGIYLDEWGWRNSAKDAEYTDEEIALALRALSESKPGAGYDYYYDEALKLIRGYDTGGYTGSWGPDGRLAVLHQKELVLNAQDTSNFLAAAGVLRNIAGMIDLQAMYQQMISPTAAVAQTGSIGGFLEQAVHIEASFPNVSDRNEIQEAFNNILNTAAQYANRKS